MNRELYTVTPAGNGAPRAWELRRDGEVRGYFDTQQAAINCGVMLARNRLKLLGKRSELQIHGRDGQIKDKRTYGDDPPETRG